MKILVLDDHAIVRHGVRLLLARIAGAVISEAADVAEAAALCRASLPDVVVLDINLKTGTGFDLERELASTGHNVRIVVFTLHAEPAYAVRALAAGALGYVAKTSPPEELIAAVRRAAEGERYVDAAIAEQVALRAAMVDDPISRLSGRETEILRLLGEGRSLAEIADLFGVAYKTVANTSVRLKDKLGARRTADLIRFAIEHRDFLDRATSGTAGAAPGTSGKSKPWSSP